MPRTPSWTRKALALAALGASALIPAAHAAPPAQPITNIDAWARLVRMPATRPVDVVFIVGDSTIVTLGAGQGRAIHEVLGERYPAFATAFMPPGINNGAGLTLNMGWDWVDGGGDSQTGAPAPFDSIFQRTETDPFVFDGHYTRYGYFDHDPPTTVTYGASLSAASRLDLRGPVRFQVWYAAGPSVAGSFCPQIRYQTDSVGPYRTLSTDIVKDAIDTNAPDDRIASYSTVLPADPERSNTRPIFWNVGGNIELGLSATAGTTFFGGRAYAENARNGYALSIVDQVGGESDYGLAVRCRDWLEHGAGESGRSPSYDLIIGALRERQIAMGFKPRILLIIQGMGNSYVEGGRSINDVAINSSPGGVEDNITDIYHRWEKFRIRAGYDSSEFTYALVGFTVIDDIPDKEAFFDKCRKRLAKWTAGRRNVCFIDWSGFMTAAETHQWATWGFDQVHLTLEGYKTIWRRAFNHGLNYPIQLKMAGD